MSWDLRPTLLFSVSNSYLLNHVTADPRWKVTDQWLWDTPEHPHVVSLLAHILPHHNDEIFVAEMRTILTLSGMRAREKAHQHRKIIPVSCNMDADPPFSFVIAPELILKKKKTRSL